MWFIGFTYQSPVLPYPVDVVEQTDTTVTVKHRKLAGHRAGWETKTFPTISEHGQYCQTRNEAYEAGIRYYRANGENACLAELERWR